MRHRFLAILCAILLLSACLPKRQLPVTTVIPTTKAVSTQTTVPIFPSATVVSEVQTWNKLKLPAGCRFSSISPNFDWIIYTCGDKLSLAKTADLPNATLVIPGDKLIGTSWSPDGMEFAVGTYRLDQGNNYIASLWLSKRGAPSERRLLYQGDFFCDLQLWSPNGKWILAAGGSAKSSNAILIRTDGTGREEAIAPIGLMHWTDAASWSPDGTHLAYASDEGWPKSATIRVLDVSSNTTTLFYTRTGSILMPAWSPDGKTIAILADSYPIELVVVDSSSTRILIDLTLPTKWKPSYDLFWSPGSDRIVIPFDPLGHEIGIVSLPSGEMFEQPVEDLWWILGWTRDGKSLVVRSHEGDQVTIETIPVR